MKINKTAINLIAISVFFFAQRLYSNANSSTYRRLAQHVRANSNTTIFFIDHTNSHPIINPYTFTSTPNPNDDC